LPLPLEICDRVLTVVNHQHGIRDADCFQGVSEKERLVLVVLGNEYGQLWWNHGSTRGMIGANTHPELFTTVTPERNWRNQRDLRRPPAVDEIEYVFVCAACWQVVLRREPKSLSELPGRQG
jgi:hypothetical protein